MLHKFCPAILQISWKIFVKTSRPRLLLPPNHTFWASFSIICNDKISFLRCSKLSENDNFDGRNWLQVIHDFISFYDVCVAEIGSPFWYFMPWFWDQALAKRMMGSWFFSWVFRACFATWNKNAFVAWFCILARIRTLSLELSGCFQGHTKTVFNCFLNWMCSALVQAVRFSYIFIFSNVCMIKL